MFPKLEYIGNVYRPSDDTWLLLSMVDEVKPRGRLCIDLGAGSGIVGLYAMLNGYCEKVVFVDISDHAVGTTKYNAELNGVDHRALVVQSDSTVLIEGVADVVMANPPYLPAYSPEELDITTEGGVEGYETAVYFVEFASSALRQGGLLFMVYSSLSKPEIIEHSIVTQGFRILWSKSKNFFYETIIAVGCEKSW